MAHGTAVSVLSDQSKINGVATIRVCSTAAVADAAAGRIDASALADADTDPRLQIESIRWSGACTLTIDDDEDDNLLVNLTGNGYWTGLAIKNQLATLEGSTDPTGNIIVTSTGACTVIVELRKIAGYDNRSDYGN
tara:strand:+ start:106 stop:513 length:408 start_codon:yes stop_codon:yes gene_type:complete